MNSKSLNDYNIEIGKLPKGPLNKISDVPGIKVGHCTLDNEDHKTGVTVIIPSENNIFENKLIASSFVLNGFGKSLGLVQIDELGTLETPITITNTLNVGLVHDAIIEYMIKTCKKENIDIRSINPVVCECNDSGLNNIQERAVHKEHVFKAIENACSNFDEGDVGAGKGTVCYGLKGGIGSSSRIIELDGNKYTLGVLVQSNHGILDDLIVDNNNIGSKLREYIETNVVDKGSIIIIIATDMPLSDRQLKRIIKRASVGLARTGSFIGHGSGEVMIGFSTANTIHHSEKNDIININILNENSIDKAFRAVAEATEEAVLKSLLASDTVTGFDKKTKYSINEFLNNMI